MSVFAFAIWAPLRDDGCVSEYYQTTISNAIRHHYRPRVSDVAREVDVEFDGNVCTITVPGEVATVEVRELIRNALYTQGVTHSPVEWAAAS